MRLKWSLSALERFEEQLQTTVQEKVEVAQQTAIERHEAYEKRQSLSDEIEAKQSEDSQSTLNQPAEKVEA